MDTGLGETVRFSKPLNLKDLIGSEGEFKIDIDFTKTVDIESLNNGDMQLSEEEDDSGSDLEDILQNIEQSTDKLLLSSLEYKSFDELATKMTDCGPSGDVKILIMEEGNGPLVPYDAEVVIHYAAYWENGKIPFDSTLTMNCGAPLRLRLGEGKLISGLEIGLTTVRGPTARFYLLLQPSATWSKLGVLPRIKPEPTLFVIALYDVKDVQAAARFNDLPKEEQTKYETTLKTVNSLHDQAKHLFTKKKYKKAVIDYQHSISVLRMSQPQTSEEEEMVKKLKIKSYVNLVMCHYKLDKPKQMINLLECLDSITDVEKNCKCLFYYGRAYQLMGKYEDALKYYKRALKMEPKNTDIGRALADLNVYVKKSAQNEKQMWRKAMNLETEVKKEKAYNIDEQFREVVMDMCKDLAGRKEYAKFDLPNGLTKDEVDCIKDLVEDFNGLAVHVEGEGKSKKVFILKKLLG